VLTEKEIHVLELRKQGLTQVDVAKELSITQAAVSNFEKNAYRKISDAKTILEVAKKMGVKSDN